MNKYNFILKNKETGDRYQFQFESSAELYLLNEYILRISELDEIEEFGGYWKIICTGDSIGFVVDSKYLKQNDYNTILEIFKNKIKLLR